MVLSIEGLPSEKWYERFKQPSETESDSKEHSDIEEPLDSESVLSLGNIVRQKIYQKL